MQDVLHCDKKPVLCAVYTRVSTDMQAEKEFNSCEAQEARIRSFVASQEGFQVFKVYTDAGFSGANTDRPALKDMLRDIRNCGIGMVVTYKIDRLTRSPRDFYQLIEFFEERGAGFISVTERFDTSTPSGRLLRNIMLTFAQFERELISERTRDKVQQKAQRGMYFGGTPPFGYKAEGGKLVLDPPRDEAVRTIYNTYAETGSVRSVLSLLRTQGVTSQKGKPIAEPTVWHILQKRIYTGVMPFNGKHFPGQHPAIISEELFNHVQGIRRGGFRGSTHAVPSLPLAKIIRCQECGNVMTPCYTDKKTKGGTRRYSYYRCSNLSRQGWNSCSVRQINADRFHDMIYKNLLRISMDSDYMKNIVGAHRAHLTKGCGGGLEPAPVDPSLTPENLKNALEELLTIFARRTGMERILAIRRIVTRINYSEKTISVEEVRRPGGTPAVDLARPHNGKFVLNHRPTRAALSAAQIESPSARTSESESCPSPRTTKKPGRSSRPDLMSEFASLPNGARYRTPNL
ncbi:MAG: recombinase family protein [Elusimicrobia bacterium]|nr:recombinase family protein [Elusimicrobiota bacterium]